MQREDREASARAIVVRKRTDLAEMLSATDRTCARCRFASGNGYSQCLHPVHVEARLDRINGKVETFSRVSTMVARARNAGLCGPEGRLFEPQALPARIYRKWRGLHWWFRLMTPLLGAGAALALLDSVF